MKVGRLVKCHWKKIILSIYVVTVLVISATVKAEVALNSKSLKQELKEISAEITFMKERRLLDIQTSDITSGSLDASGQSLVGYFEIKHQDFINAPKVYFVAVPSKAHFEVDLNATDIEVDQIEANKLYQVDGFVVKQSFSSRPQILPHFIVTSIKTQR